MDIGYSAPVGGRVSNMYVYSLYLFFLFVYFIVRHILRVNRPVCHG